MGQESVGANTYFAAIVSSLLKSGAELATNSRGLGVSRLLMTLVCHEASLEFDSLSHLVLRNI